MSDVCQIRFATPSDATRLAAMSRDYVELGLGWGWTPQRVARSIGDRATNVVMAEADGVFAGFGIMKYRDDEAHLLLFAVQPVYRRRGIGSSLLLWLETTARTAGIELIFLEARSSNRAAREFYRAHGYRELAVLQGYYRGREDAIRIGKDFTEIGRTLDARG